MPKKAVVRHVLATVAVIAGLVALALFVAPAAMADRNDCGGVKYTAEGHRWVENLHGWSSVPNWAKEKHRLSVRCAKGPSHRRVMRIQWRRMLRTLLPENHDVWVRIGRCEQPGSGYMGVHWSHPGPTFQGGLGFYYGTWDGYKPSGFPADAGQASWRQQMIVANRVAADVGFTAWGCY